MTDRFSPRHLAARALGAVRVRQSSGEEPLDVIAIGILLGIPTVLFITSFTLDWAIRDTDGLVAGFSLLAASLLAVVPQLSAWRQRLAERALPAEAVAHRKLDEATANTLLGVIVSISLAGLSVVLGNIIVPSTPEAHDTALPVVTRVATALLVGGGAYLLLTVLLVVILMFDAYEDANNGTSVRQRRWSDPG